MEREYFNTKGISMEERRIILGSGSPRRRELLGRTGVDFTVIVSDQEEVTKETQPEKKVQALAGLKAKAVWEKVQRETAAPGILVIGADTLVACDDKVLGKPANREEAIAMIDLLQGRMHRVSTGVCLISEGWTESWVETTEVEVLPMTMREIEDYVNTGEPYDKAGGYGIQGHFSLWVKGIRGDYNNVVGLPLCRLWQRLRALGWA